MRKQTPRKNGFMRNNDKGLFSVSRCSAWQMWLCRVSASYPTKHSLAIDVFFTINSRTSNIRYLWLLQRYPVLVFLCVCVRLSMLMLCVCVDDHLETNMYACMDVCKFYPRTWLAGSWASTTVGKRQKTMYLIQETIWNQAYWVQFETLSWQSFKSKILILAYPC